MSKKFGSHLVYTTIAFLALLGAPYIYIYDISSLRVKEDDMEGACSLYG